MQAELVYIHADLVVDPKEKGGWADQCWLKCSCGAHMTPMYGKRTDEIPPRDYMWHVCDDDPTHITEPIQSSPAFRSAFTKTF